MDLIVCSTLWRWTIAHYIVDIHRGPGALSPVKIPCSSDLVPMIKRLLLVLNTHAGKGHATKLMRNRIGPILQDAGVEYEVLVTERQGHSHEIVQAEPKLAKR